MSEEFSKASKPAVRIVLSDPVLGVLGNWKVQIAELHPEFHPTDRELVSWAVERVPALSGQNIEEIKERYFNKVDELEGILKQLKIAQLSGDEKAVASLLGRITLNRTPLGKGAARKCRSASLGTEGEGGSLGGVGE
ncbi:MAG: hypothetical protein HYZ71_06810 [Deltaproteobacteria bacterium]|nr:hypothetical protein [Deltaproteobacteria bacterium]